MDQPTVTLEKLCNVCILLHIIYTICIILYIIIINFWLRFGTKSKSAKVKPRGHREVTVAITDVNRKPEIRF